MGGLTKQKGDAMTKIMSRIVGLVILSLVLLGGHGWAQQCIEGDSDCGPVQLARMNPYVLGAGTSTVSCPAVQAGGVVANEDFDGPDDWTWSDVTGDGGTVSDDYDCSTFGCGFTTGTGKCLVVTMGDGADDAYSNADFGAEQNPIYVRVYFRIVAEGCGNSEYVHFFRIAQADGVPNFYTYLGQDASGDLRIYYDPGAQTGAPGNVESDTTLSTGTNYRLEIYLLNGSSGSRGWTATLYQETATNVYTQVATQSGTGSLGADSTSGFDHIRCGSTATANTCTSGMTIAYDLIGISTVTWVGP